MPNPRLAENRSASLRSALNAPAATLTHADALPLIGIRSGAIFAQIRAGPYRPRCGGGRSARSTRVVCPGLAG
jgi:hypothetical protein